MDPRGIARTIARPVPLLDEARSAPLHQPRAPLATTRGLRRFDSVVVFVFVVAVSLATLPQRSGYPLADAVEYLRNAALAESGQPLVRDTVRPFFFSAILVPIFRAARILGFDGGREVVAVATALMIAIGGLVGVATYRLVEKVSGAPAALAAALFLGANRVFQLWAPTVATDVPCALCVVGAAAMALRPPAPRNLVLLGALLGLAALFKYQALLPGSILFACLPFLWKGSGARGRAGRLGLVLAGLLLGLATQAVLDVVAGRWFGATLALYVRDNLVYPFGMRLNPILMGLFGKETVTGWWEWMFSQKANFAAYEHVKSMDPGLLVPEPYSYYFREIGLFLTIFEIALFVLGAIVVLVRRPRAWWLPFVVLGGSVAVLSVKASKDFRIWLPIAPFVFLFVGTGFDRAVAWIGSRAPKLAAIAAVVALAPNLIAVLGGIPLQTRIARIPQLRPFLAYDARTPIVRARDGAAVVEARGWRPWQIVPEPKNASDFGNYERAARWLNQNAPVGSRVSATWFWQFFFRLRPDLYLAEPEEQIDQYRSLPEDRRARALEHLRTLDFFATHLQALLLSPELFDFVEREFDVVATFENPIYDDSLKTLVVLRRRETPDGPGWWVRVLEGEEAEQAQRLARPDRHLLFVEGPGGSRRPVVEILDCDLDLEEAAQGHVVARILWRVPEGSVATGSDLQLYLTARNEEHTVIQEFPRPYGYKLAYDRVGPDRWKPGAVILQRVPLRPARDIHDFALPKKRNATASIGLWLQLVQFTKAGVRYPVPERERFSRWHDPDTHDVRIGGSDIVR